MHVSPCGWYCFEVDLGDLAISDTREKTVIASLDKSFEIELLSARKTSEAIDDEISHIHEEYLADNGIVPHKTVLSENPFGLKYYVTQGTGMDENTWLIAHAFWNNYCIFMQYKGIKNRNSSIGLQMFYDILQRLQPLITA